MEARGARVVVAGETAAPWAEALTAAGHLVLACLGDGVGVRRLCGQASPEVLVLDEALLPPASTLKPRLRELAQLVLVADPDGPHWPPPADGLVAKPAAPAALAAVVAVVAHNRRRLASLDAEARRLRQTIEDRKLVEKAKGRLMASEGLSPARAEERLALEARRLGLSPGETARRLLGGSGPQAR